MQEQARSVDLDASDPDRLWTLLLETEGALITEGLHVLGRPMSPEARARMIALMPEDAEARARADRLLQDETEIAGILRALAGRFVPPVPGGDLIPLAELGRPRIDVVMTLSGIFRDLLPLQTRMLAEAALKAAEADEPPSQNFIRAHVLEQMAALNCDLETAALRVFSNAEGAYG
jgi:cobalamin biosynthesis Mg chelatase CobN